MGEPTGQHRRLLVMRHGVTGHNAAGIWQGRLDTPLSPDGEVQARAAAPAIATYAPSVVLSSDLGRAARTAEIVCEQLPGVELRTDPRLQEIHVGQWQGLSQEDVRREFPDVAGQLDGLDDFRRGVDGETFEECADRATPAVRELLAELAVGETGLVVTHGVVARAVVGDLLGLPRRLAWATFGTLGNCQWAELVEENGRWVCRGWGLRPGFGTPAMIR